MPESKDVVILQLKIEEGTGKKIPEATKEVEVLSGSIVGLAKANKELRAERGKLDTQSAEGAKRIQELNQLIDKNNDIIKENVSNLEKQRLNVGNYRRGVTDALKELRIGGINVGDVVDKLGKANDDLFKGMIAGYQQSGIAAKLFGNAARTALTLTGIGILIAGIATLIAHWDDLTRSLNLFGAESKRVYENTQKSIEDSNKALEQQLELMQAAGTEQRILNEATLDALKKELDTRQDTVEHLNQEIEARERNRRGRVFDLIFGNEAQKQLDEELKSIDDLIHRINLLTVAQQSEANETKKTTDVKTEAVEKDIDFEGRRRLVAEEGAEAEQEFRDLQIKSLEEFQSVRVRTTIESNQRIADANKNLADQNIANEQREIDAKAAFTASKIGFAFTLSAALTQLAGKNKVLAIAAILIEKAAAIAGIVSNTAVANLKAIAASPLTFGMPWVAINTGTAIASGIGVVAQAANSISEIAGFTHGGKVDKQGTFSGPSHAGGGISYIRSDGKHKINVEGDENFYILKKSASAEANYLSTLNQKHGGRSFGQKTWYAAQGGQIETRDIAGRSNNIERTVRSVMANMPPIVVTVEDINAKQSEVSDNTTKARVL